MSDSSWLYNITKGGAKKKSKKALSSGGNWLSDLTTGKGSNPYMSGFSTKMAAPDYNYDEYLKDNPAAKFTKQEFTFPTQNPLLDPYQGERAIDPLHAPLRIPVSNMPRVPQESKDAVLALPDGRDLLHDKSYWAARTARGELHRKLADVGKDKQMNDERMNPLASLAGWMGVAGADAFAIADANRKYQDNRTVGSALGNLIKGNSDSHFRQTSGAAVDNLLNFGEGLGKILGDYATVAGTGDKVTDQDFTKFAEFNRERNVEKAKKLQDTYGASEELSRYGWKRDNDASGKEKFLRGLAGVGGDTALDPSFIFGFGNGAGAKSAAREFVENGAKASAQTVGRAAYTTAAKEGVKPLAQAGLDALTSGVTDAATHKSIARHLSKLGKNESASMYLKAVEAAQKPLTVLENASKVTGTDQARFISEVQKVAKQYGRDGAEVLAKDSTKFGKAGLDRVDQKIVDIALRRSNNEFGAYGLDIPFVGTTRNMSLSRELGSAVSNVLEFDPISKIALERGNAVGRGSIADLMRKNTGRLERTFEKQGLAKNAAMKRLATEVAAHNANEFTKEAMNVGTSPSTAAAAALTPQSRILRSMMLNENDALYGGIGGALGATKQDENGNRGNLKDIALGVGAGILTGRAGENAIKRAGNRSMGIIDDTTPRITLNSPDEPPRIRFEPQNDTGMPDIRLPQRRTPADVSTGLISRIDGSRALGMLRNGEAVFYGGMGEYPPVIADASGRVHRIAYEDENRILAEAMNIPNALSEYTSRELYRNPDLNLDPVPATMKDILRQDKEGFLKFSGLTENDVHNISIPELTRMAQSMGYTVDDVADMFGRNISDEDRVLAKAMEHAGGSEHYFNSNLTPEQIVSNGGITTATDLKGFTDIKNLESPLYRFIERADDTERSYNKGMTKFDPKQIHYFDKEQQKWFPVKTNNRLERLVDGEDTTGITDYIEREMKGDGSNLPDEWFDVRNMPKPLRELAKSVYTKNGVPLYRGEGTVSNSIPREQLLDAEEKFINLVYALNNGKEELTKYQVRYGENPLDYLDNNGLPYAAPSGVSFGLTPEKIDFLGDGIYEIKPSEGDFSKAWRRSFAAPTVQGNMELSIDHNNKEVYVDWMGIGGGTTQAKEHSNAGTAVNSLMQKVGRIIKRDYPDYTITNSPGNSNVDRLYRMMGFTDKASTKGHGSIQYIPKGGEAFAAAPLGAAAGLQEDENGNTNLDWKLAAGGMLAAGIGGRAAIKGAKMGEFEKLAGLAQKIYPKAETEAGFDPLATIAAAKIPKGIKALLNADGSLTREGEIVYRVLLDQKNLGNKYATQAEEKLLSLNPIDKYQPSRLPNQSRGRIAQGVQSLLYDESGKTSRSDRTLVQELLGKLTGHRGFTSPERDSAERLAASQQNMYGVIDSAEKAFQKNKSYANPAARSSAGILTETNPYQAFGQVEAEQNILKAQEDFLSSLAGAYGTRLSPEAAAVVPDSMKVVLQDGTAFKMPDAATAKRISDLATTGNVLGKGAGADNPIANVLEGAGRIMTPFMTVARPAFTAINTLGNLDLMGRSGYGKEIPRAAYLQSLLAKAGGDVEQIADPATRDLLRGAEENGVINALDLNPSTIFDPSHDSPVMRGKYNPLGYAMKANQRVNALSENNARLAVYLEEIARNGGNEAAARQRVDDILFNYDVNALTKGEQELRKFAPFYTFFRRNVPATSEYYAKHPQRIATLNRIEQNFGDTENENQGQMERSMPPYLREQTMFKQGDSVRNVRLPSTEGLNAIIDNGDKALRGDVGALLNPMRDLVAPQYSTLSSLISGYNDRGDKISTGDGNGTGWDLAENAVDQFPIVGSLINAIDKQNREPIKGGDSEALNRFVRNQGWVPSIDMMFPTTDYNPAAWERSNAIIGNEDLKDYATSLKRPTKLQQLIAGQEPVDIPLDSQALVDARNLVAKMKGDIETSNKINRVEYDDTQRAQRFLFNFERYRQSGKKYYLSRVDKDGKSLTDNQWELIKQYDPAAYSYYHKKYSTRGSKTLQQLLGSGGTEGVTMW